MQDLESEIRRPLKRVCETAGSSTFQTPAFYCVRQFTAYLFHQQDGLMEYCGVLEYLCSLLCSLLHAWVQENCKMMKTSPPQ